MRSTATARQTARTAPQTGSQPTVRQVYCLAHELADLLGLEWPADRTAASALIDRLQRHAAAERQSTDDVLQWSADA